MNGKYDYNGWGRIYASVIGAVDRAAFLGLYANTLPGGGSVRAEGTLYFFDRFEAGASLGLGGGQVFTDSRREFLRAQASVGAAVWVTREVRLQCSYQLTRTAEQAAPGIASTVHELGLSLGVRQY